MIELPAEGQNAFNLEANTLRLQQFSAAIAIRDHDGDPVALLHFQGVGNAFTDNDLLLPGFKVLPRIVLHILR
ncbi:hypothetical protein D3C75_1101950 [compost metagenome]